MMKTEIAFIDEETFTDEDWFDMIIEINEELEAAETGREEW